MRENNLATEIDDSLSECINACAMLCTKKELQRDAILEAVSWFVDAAPLVDLPEVAGPKDLIRQAAEIAAKVQPLVLTWDETTELPQSLVSLAREFLEALGMAHLTGQGAAP
jgi:hypothetical protein